MTIDTIPQALAGSITMFSSTAEWICRETGLLPIQYTDSAIDHVKGVQKGGGGNNTMLVLLCFTIPVGEVGCADVTITQETLE